MERWTIQNRFFAVSHDQFLNMAKQFKQAAEHSFNTPCYMDIEILSQPKFKPTLKSKDQDAQDAIDSFNKNLRIMSTSNIDDIDKQTWDHAGNVEISIRPTNKDRAPQAAYAVAEFANVRPGRASFYIQP